MLVFVVVVLWLNVLFSYQWGLFTTVYQEEYFALLNATEVGMKITYDPQNILSYSSAFPYYASAAIKEVSVAVLILCPFYFFHTIDTKLATS